MFRRSAAMSSNHEADDHANVCESNRVSEDGEANSEEIAMDFYMLSGQRHCIKASLNASLRAFRLAVEASFGVPPREQVIFAEPGGEPNPTVVFPLQGGEYATLQQVGVEAGMSFQLLRQDPRTTSEKNCELVEALHERRMQDALDIIRSSGFPIDPNGMHRWSCPRPGFLSGGRDFHDVKETMQPALTVALKARRQWDSAGKVCGDGACEDEVALAVEELIRARADVNISSTDIHTCGSWPDTSSIKSPLFTAIETGNVSCVRLLLNAGADSQLGNTEQQFRPKGSSCSDAARKLNASDAVKQEICMLLSEHAAR